MRVQAITQQSCPSKVSAPSTKLSPSTQAISISSQITSEGTKSLDSSVILVIFFVRSGTHTICIAPRIWCRNARFSCGTQIHQQIQALVDPLCPCPPVFLSRDNLNITPVRWFACIIRKLVSVLVNSRPGWNCAIKVLSLRCFGKPMLYPKSLLGSSRNFQLYWAVSISHSTSVRFSQNFFKMCRCQEVYKLPTLRNPNAAPPFQAFSTSDCDWLMAPGQPPAAFRVTITDAAETGVNCWKSSYIGISLHSPPVLKVCHDGIICRLQTNELCGDTFYITETSGVSYQVLYFRMMTGDSLCALVERWRQAHSRRCRRFVMPIPPFKNL